MKLLETEPQGFQRQLTDPAEIDHQAIARMVAAGDRVTIQFSKASSYSPELLADVERVGSQHGARVCVRFFDHRSAGFDARVLMLLPSVGNLAIDCMSPVSNIEEVGRLTNLVELGLGGELKFELSELLTASALTRLEVLSLYVANARLDLAPVARMPNLRELLVVGGCRSFDAIGEAASLRRLYLNQWPRAVPLSFLSRLRSLADLSLILGGRDDLGDIEIPSLRNLEISRVRGLSTLHLEGFPGLLRLRLEDQPQLTSLHLPVPNLIELALVNCRQLAALGGLADLEALRVLVIQRTGLDVMALVELDLPSSLELASLGTSKRADDDAIERRLRSLGVKTPMSG